MQNRINMLFENDAAVRCSFEEMCIKFNCLNYAKKAPANLYHVLSGKVHGGGYPIEIHTKDNTFSQAEYAFIIAVMKENLSGDAFKVFDANDEELYL